MSKLSVSLRVIDNSVVSLWDLGAYRTCKQPFLHARADKKIQPA